MLHMYLITFYYIFFREYKSSSNKPALLIQLRIYTVIRTRGFNKISQLKRCANYFECEREKVYFKFEKEFRRIITWLAFRDNMYRDRLYIVQCILVDASFAGSATKYDCRKKLGEAPKSAGNRGSRSAEFERSLTRNLNYSLRKSVSTSNTLAPIEYPWGIRQTFQPITKPPCTPGTMDNTFRATPQRQLTSSLNRRYKDSCDEDSNISSFKLGKLVLPQLHSNA